ncbi:MAG: hypothetical protein HYU66_05135, partial [Armatimonadetes bacterium]|nr:hypothetical protein [Armatimonadota bacterium]
ALLPAAPQGTTGRIDISVTEGGITLSGPRASGLASVGFCGFLGQGKERMGVSCEKRLGKVWEPLWIEFTADGDGRVDIQLQGEWYPPGGPDDVRLVLVDRVETEGTAIENGGFEQAGADSRPAAWRITGAFPPERWRRDGRTAQSGRACLAIWYGSAARQGFSVERGKRYRVGAWFRLLDPAAVKEPETVRLEFPAATYRQEVELRLSDEAAARRATLALAPLLDGCEWAVSSRWDDNNGDDVKMRDVLARHGQHGTFYLNSLWPEWPAGPAAVDSAFGRQILEGGNSIGAHSLTHPLLSYCHRNRIFEETAGDRMVWEAATDRPVVSYAFSYCNFVNGEEGLAVQADIARALERGGFYSIANEPQWEDLPTELVLSPILPSDGMDIDTTVEAALASDDFRRQHPNLTHSMHVWYRTPEAWAKFEGQLDAYGHREGWWYCNQNQYAAYRYQFARTRLTPLGRRGAVLRFALERPCLLDLNDPVPLTLEVLGVRPSEVAELRCPTAGVVPSGRGTTTARFNLAHDRDQGLPARIGLVMPNRNNRAEPGDADHDPDLPYLTALLHYTDGRLSLELAHHGDQPLRGIRATFRLPLAWREGVVRQSVPDLPAGATRTVSFRPTLARSDYRHTAGPHFFVAQLDFARGAERCRLHTACHALVGDVDHSYPLGGFLRLGPVRQPLVDPGKLAADVLAGRVGTQPWLLADDTRLAWQPDGGPGAPPHLDVEWTALSGVWMGGEGLYLLRTTLHSEGDQTVRLKRSQVPLLVLNGENVAGAERIRLRAGANPVFMMATAAFGCYLRLEDPQTGARVTNVSFEPGQPANAEPPYTPQPLQPADRKSLAGKWRAKLLVKLPPAAGIEHPHPDAGPSDEAKQAMATDFDDSGWSELEVPKRWLDLGGDWSANDGEAVFRRVVSVPDAWAGRDLTLSLGRIDDFDVTCFNGTTVGSTDAAVPDFYAAPRRYRVPGALVRAGPNVIAVRIFDHFGDGGFTGNPADLFLAPAGG